MAPELPDAFARLLDRVRAEWQQDVFRSQTDRAVEETLGVELEQLRALEMRRLDPGHQTPPRVCSYSWRLEQHENGRQWWCLEISRFRAFVGTEREWLVTRRLMWDYTASVPSGDVHEEARGCWMPTLTPDAIARALLPDVRPGDADWYQSDNYLQSSALNPVTGAPTPKRVYALTPLERIAVALEELLNVRVERPAPTD